MTPAPRIALCAGSFDPITRGHEEIVRRTLAIADRVIVAVAHHASQSKRGMFGVEERVEMIREVFRDEPRVEAAHFQGLVVEFARARGATLIVRGLRGTADFEYEAQMARMNRELATGVETVLLASAPQYVHLSSSLIREIAALGGEVERFVSEPVLRRIRARIGGGSP